MPITPEQLQELRDMIPPHLNVVVNIQDTPPIIFADETGIHTILGIPSKTYLHDMCYPLCVFGRGPTGEHWHDYFCSHPKRKWDHCGTHWFLESKGTTQCPVVNGR